MDALCDRARDLWLAGDGEPAVRLWSQAADAGSIRAAYNLGVVAESRDDMDEARRWYGIAADADPPYPLALYNLSVIAIADGDLVVAAELAERAADSGVALGAFNRAQIASWASDIATAKRWWVRADELGDEGAAAYNLGIHANQDGDKTEARRWFERSAERGYPDGMNNFGVFLRQEGDLAGSVELYERAAEAGSALAMRNLAELAQLEGRAGDAQRWLSLAAESDGEEDQAVPLPSLPANLGGAGQRPSMDGQLEALFRDGTSGDPSPTGTASHPGRFCTECGQERHGDGKFCIHCGARAQEP